MATTNYSLPTLESTALFDLVTDYNALANATDTALASVAGHIPTETISEMQRQINALQTLTGSQGTQLTTLQSQMTTANGNISTLQSGLATANKNIGTLQTGLQGANTSISKANNTISELNTMMKPIVVIPGLDITFTGGSIKGNVFCNPASKLLIFSLNAKITHNFTSGTSPSVKAFSQALPKEYRPTQNRRIFVGDAMSGNAACNLQLDINADTGEIVPNIGGINNVQSFTVNGNGVLMYDLPNDANTL